MAKKARSSQRREESLSPERISPIVRILEPIGRRIRALGVPRQQQWAAVGTLMAYILGVSSQNAANGQLARSRGLDRAGFLEDVSTAWAQLDPQEYPFARSIAGQVRDHDDRADFLAGIDLILRGIDSPRRPPQNIARRRESNSGRSRLRMPKMAKPPSASGGYQKLILLS